MTTNCIRQIIRGGGGGGGGGGVDDPNHSMRSEIQLFDFQDSPERILLHLSEKAQIIVISATATLYTVIGNCDLEYLLRMLQDKFYVMPEVDKCRLQ